MFQKACAWPRKKVVVNVVSVRRCTPVQVEEARACEQQTCLGSASLGFEPRVAYVGRVRVRVRDGVRASGGL